MTGDSTKRSSDLRQVFDDLVRFETVLWGAIDQRLRAECEVSLGSLNVLMVIDSVPRCRVYDIAAALAITVGGTSQAVDRLQAAGWCQRRPNPDDRRSSILELTAQGSAALAGAGAVFDAELDRFLGAPLSPTALTQLGSALHKVRRAAVEQHVPAPRHPTSG